MQIFHTLLRGIGHDALGFIIVYLPRLLYHSAFPWRACQRTQSETVDENLIWQTNKNKTHNIQENAEVNSKNKNSISA